MERQPTPEHNTPIKSYEQLALEALVDVLFTESDKKTFAVLTKILEASEEH